MYITGIRRCLDDVCLNDVSPNEKSRMFRPLDNASLGGHIPWTMHPLDDAFLGCCIPNQCVSTLNCTEVLVINCRLT